MKKYLFILSAGFICLLTSCSEKKEGGMSATAKKNLDAMHTVVTAFETGDTSKINDVVSADFIDHTDRGVMVGTDSLKAAVTMMHKMDSTLKFNLVKELADDEYVTAWYKITGISDGYMGMPKGPYEMNSVDVVKFKDGKATEHWSFLEMTEVMKMMSSPPAAMDSMNHK
jgi:predicted SnoaL-like aldol condensation-catalyzing enzyme